MSEEPPFVQTIMNPVTGHFETQAEIDAAKAAARGMSLRDWYAGQALAGLLAADPQKPETISPQQAFENLARAAYTLADAMLAARERKP